MTGSARLGSGTGTRPPQTCSIARRCASAHGPVRCRRERDGPLGGGFSRERQRVGEKHPDRLRRSEAERGEVRRRKDVYGRGRDGEQEWRTKELGTVYFLERSAVVARELAELARIEAGEPGDDDEEDEEEDEDDEGPAIPPPPTLLTSAAAAGLALVSALPSCAFKKTFNAKAQEAWARDVAESPFLQLRARISELEAEIHESIWCQGYAEEVRLAPYAHLCPASPSRRMRFGRVSGALSQHARR